MKTNRSLCIVDEHLLSALISTFLLASERSVTNEISLSQHSH